VIYRIFVRQLTNDDFSKECPFPNEDKEFYDPHLNALVEDIGNLQDIISASVSNDVVSIESDLDKNALLDRVKPFFSREFCYVRYKKIEISS
jgi:hypothetical protein